MKKSTNRRRSNGLPAQQHRLVLFSTVVLVLLFCRAAVFVQAFVAPSTQRAYPQQPHSVSTSIRKVGWFRPTNRLAFYPIPQSSARPFTLSSNTRLRLYAKKDLKECVPLSPTSLVCRSYQQLLNQVNDNQLYAILEELCQTNFFRLFRVDVESRNETLGTLEEWLGNQKHADSLLSLADSEDCGDEGCLLDWGDEDETDHAAAQGLSSSSDDTASTVMPAPAMGQEDCEEECELVWPEDDEKDETTMAQQQTSGVTVQTLADGMDDCGKEECLLDLGDDEDNGAQVEDNDKEPSRQEAVTASMPAPSAEDDDCEEECVIDWGDDDEMTPTDPLQQKNTSRRLNDSVDVSLDSGFWKDLSSKIYQDNGTKILDLVLNPETNTGYNGSEVWKAMYDATQKPRVNGDKEADSQEEMFLYRLLSGMHTSTSLSIARNYFAPSKRKNRDNWEPNLSYFNQKLQGQSEYIQNLYFAMAVLLRAAEKATQFLKNCRFDTGYPEQDVKAIRLLERFLDSPVVMESCGHVFGAFDETALFESNEESNEHASSAGARLKRESFKRSFHLVSFLLDFISCQQCKMHGKLSVTAFGVALKMLFSEPEELPRAISRNEIVAFINTIFKFSQSIKDLSVLNEMCRQEQIDESEEQWPDTIVVGSGLAGLVTALQVLDRRGNVVIIEKESTIGGNSNRASSGINALVGAGREAKDSFQSFFEDTVKSAGASSKPDLIEILVKNSAEAVSWLRHRVGVDLSQLSQLGGHSYSRTHRPANAMVGAELIYGMRRAIREYEEQGHAKILTGTRVTKLLSDNSRTIVGVQCQNANGSLHEIRAKTVVLATGGFASDRSNESLLSIYRPDLLGMPATAGAFSTGDGISLAEEVGAGLVDMDKVQLHPTGLVDPSDPGNPTKVLAAELMRSVGGILINSEGKRFCNELGTRSYVTEQELSHHKDFAKTKKWDKNYDIPTFSLVMSREAAEDAKKHIDRYLNKGLLRRYEGVKELADWMKVDVEVLKETLLSYRAAAEKGIDQFGKTTFRNVPGEELEQQVFYAGMVVSRAYA
jgi:flavocytochrome c